MSNNKKTKVQSIEIPAIYSNLTKPDKKGASRKIVIDALRKIHSFMDSTVPVPPGIAIDMEFKNFDEFSSKNKQTILALHDEFLGSEPPKGQDTITTALYTWAYFIKEANPILAQQTATGEKIRKSSIGGRHYTKGNVDSNTVALKTPQAIKCLEIFHDSLGESTQVTEEVLKALVYQRAAELKTKQDAWRIFQYYRPKLIATGLLKHD